MAGKLVLIDGHSILNRAFYGVPDLTNGEGLHTNAVYGFLNIMFKILDEEKPDYLTVAFDVKHKTFRHEMFAEYKGTRKPMPAELHEQVPVLKELLKAMNIQIMELPGFEADDLLGTIAKRADGDDIEVRVVSGDRDLLQLATDRIMIRIPKTKMGKTEVENYYAKDVLEKYQVSPLEFIDLKALMGDTADNIPGVAGIGEKMATKIISTYHSIENAYENLDNIEPKRAGKLLGEDYESAKLSKVLATINTDAPIEIDYKKGTLENMYNSEALAIIKKLEFKKLAEKFLANGADSTTTQSVNLEELIQKISEDDIDYNALSKAEYVGIQIFEVGDVNNEPTQMTFDFLNTASNEDKEKYVLSYSFVLDEKEYVYYVELNSKDNIRKFINNLTANQVKICLFELKKHLKDFDIQDLLENSNVLEINLMAYLMNPLRDSYNYENIAREYLEIELPSIEELVGKSNIKDLYKSNQHNVIMLTSLYAYVAVKASNILKNKLLEATMWDLYSDIELPLVYALDRMEKEGILVNATELKEYGNVLKEKISLIEKEIYEEIGEEFNINSSKQLGEILFGKMGLPGSKKTKTGYSTSADVLEKLAPDYPVVNKILEYRQLTKLKSTYADGLAVYIKDDGRIHGNFNQTITATGRISSTEPNLQNIPIRMEMGKAFRKVFIPKDDYIFIDADYSQIELRILAHMSGDESLIDAYNSAQDIHRITASKVFKIPYEEVSEAMRRNAKAVNFGIVYGISSFGLSQDLSISRKEANEYIKQYFETYPGIKAFLDKTIEDAKKDGYVKTLFNRIRPIPELNSSNFMQRSFGERIAMNSPIQGTAADIMKIAMVAVDKKIKDMNLKSKIVLQVHDELLIEASKDEVDIVCDIVKESMMNAANLKVKLDINISKGLNWLEAH